MIPLNALLNSLQAPSPSLKTPLCLKNHQKWQIRCSFNDQTLCVSVQDAHGIFHDIEQIIIEDLDPQVVKALIHATTKEERHQIMQSYLYRRLAQANPYQVHCEKHKDQLALYIGSYGLKGGGKIQYLLLSLAEFGSGVYYKIQGNKKTGDALLSAGVKGLLYVYNTKEEEVNVDDYLRESVCGAVVGGIAGHMGDQTDSGLRNQALSSGIGSGLSTLISELWKEKEIKPKAVLQQTAIGAVSGGVSAAVSSAMGHLLHSNVMQSVGSIQDAAVHTLKKAAQGGASSASSKIIANAFEEKPLSQGVVQSATVGAAVSAVIVGAEQVKNQQDQNRLEQTEKELQQATAEKAKQEQQLERSQKVVKLSQEEFAERQQNLHRLRQGEVSDKGTKGEKTTLPSKQYMALENAASRLQKKVTYLQTTIQQKEIDLKAAQTQAVDNQVQQTELAQLKQQLQHCQAQAACHITNMDHLSKGDQRALAQAETVLTQKQFKLQQQSRLILNLSAALEQQQKGVQAARKGQGINTFNRLHLRALHSTESIDCDKDELIEHVVLVHALNHITFPVELLLGKPGFDMDRYNSDDEKYKLNAYLQAIVSLDGIVGNHLRLEKREIQEPLIDRPHMHWSWNQLVQPNSGGNWEAARIAFLEPLTTFERSADHKPVSVAPYDTLTIGAHRFSEHSILLVPETIRLEAEAYLTQFQGRILSYDPSKTLRCAVIEALKDYYKQTWHVCDADGRLIGHEVRPSSTGYMKKTYITPGKGQLIELIEGEGHDIQQQKSRAMRAFRESKRFIGLHARYTTITIEKDPYFQLLKAEGSISYKIKRTPHLFVGGLETPTVANIKKLGVLKALHIYQYALTEHEANTGAHRMANYYIEKAMYADLVSLFHQTQPNEQLSLLDFEVRILFVSGREVLINLLENMRNCLGKPDLNQKQKAIEYFNLYCSLLRESLTYLHQAKRDAFSINIQPDKIDCLKERQPLCFLVGQAEWAKVDIPEEVTFDLNAHWPLEPALDAYSYKILNALPANIQNLQELYHLTSLLSSEDREKTYKLNVIREHIRWALLERVYLNLRNDEQNSLLAARLEKDGSWITSYGLVFKDYTIQIGDCLFDNIGAQLIQEENLQGSLEDLSRQLRQNVARFMQSKENFYASRVMPLIEAQENTLSFGNGGVVIRFDSWNRYLELIAQERVWVTEVEIEALSSMLQRPVALMTFKQQTRIYNRDINPDANPLILCHVNRNHFISCMPRKGLALRDVYPMILNNETQN